MGGLIHLLNEYGYFTVFLSVMVELILLPIPNEALLSYVGILSFDGKMNLILSYLSAGLGGIGGATISYWIGYKLGVPFFRKFGRYIHLGPDKLEKMSGWYQKYGKVLLIFSYFIPGIRHIASIISGVIRLRYRSFCIYSYIGVFLWTSTFISLGYLLGPKWDKYQGEIKKWLVLASLCIGLIIICYIAVRMNRRYIKEAALLIFQSVFKQYKSLIKMKLIVFLVLILFVSFFALMIGMIQDFISNEFAPFNTIVQMIIFTLFNAHWRGIFSPFYLLSSWTALGIISVMIIVTIFFKRTNQWLELLFLAITAAGSLLFSNGIRWLFRFMLSGKNISSDFPNEQSLLLIVFYGFLLIMLIRHQKSYLYGVLLLSLFLFILLVYSISGIYLAHIAPSDLVAGYVFGAVWVSGMILSLELFRFLSLIRGELE